MREVALPRNTIMLYVSVCGIPSYAFAALCGQLIACNSIAPLGDVPVITILQVGE